MKRIICVICALCMMFCCAVPCGSAWEVDVSAKAYVVMDMASRSVILEGNSHMKLPMASTTKIMSALLCLESGDLDSEFTVDSNAIKVEGSSMGLLEGDIVSKRDLCYGMLLPSGCECCFTAAFAISGSETAFVELMNQKAAELGMTGTHYANCTGLPNSDHYTTPYDMTILMRYAIQNDIFRMVDTSQSYTATNGLYMRSTMFKSLINNYGTTAVTGGEILGGKTGTTNAAGSCLTSFANIYGREYILCTTKASGSGNNTGDARKVYNRLGSALS